MLLSYISFVKLNSSLVFSELADLVMASFIGFTIEGYSIFQDEHIEGLVSEELKST